MGGCECSGESQRFMLGVSLHHSLLYILRQDFSLNLKLTNSTTVANQLAMDALFLPFRYWDYRLSMMLLSHAFYMGIWDLHISVASALSTELPPQALRSIFEIEFN